MDTALPSPPLDNFNIKGGNALWHIIKKLKCMKDLYIKSGMM